MAKFVELKDQLGFIDETIPVLVISLNQELINKANSEPKENKRKRELAKLEKAFNSKLSKDILKKGYEIIEDYERLDEEESDPILKRELHVVVPKNSFTYLSDLKPVEQAFFSAGVRIMDSIGNVALIPELIDFEGVADTETDLTTAIDQYDNVVQVLRHIEENGLSEEYAEDEESEEVENNEEPEGNDHKNSEERIENRDKETVKKEDSQAVEVVDETELKAVYSDVGKVEGQTVDLIVESKKDADSHDSRTVELKKQPVENQTDFFQQLENRIASQFETLEISSIDLPIEKTREIEGVRELEPILSIAKESMNNRISLANQKIASTISKSITELNDLGKDLLKDELHTISSLTSLDNPNSPFLKAIEEIKAEHEEKKKEIDVVVNERTKVLRQQYEEEKRSFVEEEKKKAEIKFDESNLSKLKDQEAQYRKEIVYNFDKQLTEGIESLESQAEAERLRAESEVVSKIFDLLYNEIEEKSKVTKTENEKIIEQTLSENEEEAKDIKEKALHIVVKSTENEERINKEVRQRTEKADELLNSLAELNSKVENLEGERFDYQKRIKDLEQVRDSLEKQLTTSTKNLNNLMDVKTSNELAYQNQFGKAKHEAKAEDFSTKKMITILGSVGLICASVLTFAIFNGISANSVSKAEPTVESTAVQAVDSTTIESSSEETFTAIPTTNKKVGDTINIDPENNGTSVPAIIKSITNEIATVETSEGKQFFVQLNQ